MGKLPELFLEFEDVRPHRIVLTIKAVNCEGISRMGDFIIKLFENRETVGQALLPEEDKSKWANPAA